MAWWAPKSSQTTASSATHVVVDIDDDDEACIDLTSDTEGSRSPSAAAAVVTSSSSTAVPSVSPWVLKMTAKNEVKYEGMKRAAEASAKAQQSGEVLVTDKPSQPIEEVPISRPAKRSKGSGAGASPSQDEDGEEEGDMEVVGTTGTAKLPHNRFACTEHTFEGSQLDIGHKERCSLCFCYVCDRLANECKEWRHHCHATDSGPLESVWKALRAQAKVLLQAEKRSPVAGLPSTAGGAASNPAQAQAEAAAAAAGSLASTGSGGGAGSSNGNNISAPQMNDCNCSTLCKPVHAVFWKWHEFIRVGKAQAKAPMVYLNGLTQEQVRHVEDISVGATVECEVKKKFSRHYPGGMSAGHAAKAGILARYKSQIAPAVRVVALAGGKSNVTVASRDMEVGRSAAERQPFKSLWTPGSMHPEAARLGRVSDIPFKISTTEHQSPGARKEYFDRFISKTPMPPTLWYSTSRIPGFHESFHSGDVLIVKKEDKELLGLLRCAYESDYLDVEATAVYNPFTNTGSFAIEVILLRKLLLRGTSLAARSPDFVCLVERCILKKVYNKSAVTSAKKKARQLSSLDCGNGAGAGAAVLGREFSPSNKWYGGRASLDVSLAGLIESVRDEETNENVVGGQIIHPAKMLLELENLQHRSLAQQPECLTVELYEHQKQDAQWMMDQEKLEGGSMQHLWAELPAHHLAPPGGQRSNEFRRCWFSPILNQFTLRDPFTSTIKGGILCDEMGLGKTAATLCLHLIHPPKTPSPGVPLDEKEWGPISGRQAGVLTDPKCVRGEVENSGKWVSKGTLVVCKVSLVGQWVEEAKRLCGGKLSIYPYHGQSRRKDPAFLAEFDIVVTTYGVVQYDASRNSGFPPLRRIRWWRVVLDESHTIASSNQAASFVRDLVSNRRWCMTGTPYISKFSDANGQLAFVGAHGAFKGIDLGDRGPNHGTQKESVAFLRRVLLRHSQGMQLEGKSILGLPTITHKVEVLTLATNERKAYVEFEKGVQKDYISVRHRLRNLAGSHTMEVLTLLSKFRQACSGGQLLIGDCVVDGVGSSPASVDAFCPICNEMLESPVKTICGHTFCQACISSVLTKKADDHGPCPKCKKTVRLEDLTPISSGASAAGGAGSSSGANSEPQQKCSSSSSGGGSSTSGESSSAAVSVPTPGSGVLMETKLKALVEKLADIHAKDPTSKSLVFSQFNSSLEWLKRTLPKKGFQFRTLTGSMSRAQRTAALTAFAKDPPTTVFLLSVRSGAVGINLTQANNVFLLEPLLNLALEKQAIGRVYRLGQARPVTVTKLVLEDSIETRILALQKKQDDEGSASAAVGATSSNGVAGNIAKDNAKNLKIEEYNELFGVTEVAGLSSAEIARRAARKDILASRRKKNKKGASCSFASHYDDYDDDYGGYDDYDGLPNCSQS